MEEGVAPTTLSTSGVEGSATVELDGEKMPRCSPPLPVEPDVAATEVGGSASPRSSGVDGSVTVEFEGEKIDEFPVLALAPTAVATEEAALLIVPLTGATVDAGRDRATAVVWTTSSGFSSKLHSRTLQS